ncbi:MAG: hypothetical protein ABIE74_00750 [Pseudomonadota bacterium]
MNYKSQIVSVVVLLGAILIAPALMAEEISQPAAPAPAPGLEPEVNSAAEVPVLGVEEAPQPIEVLQPAQIMSQSPETIVIRWDKSVVWKILENLRANNKPQRKRLEGVKDVSGMQYSITALVNKDVNLFPVTAQQIASDAAPEDSVDMMNKSVSFQSDLIPHYEVIIDVGRLIQQLGGNTNSYLIKIKLDYMGEVFKRNKFIDNVVIASEEMKVKIYSSPESDLKN